MAGGVLKEFLVSLAYSVDRSTEQRFASSVEGATKGVVALGEALTAAAVVVVAGVELMTRRFEDLYYSSKRTGASVANIKAFSYAVGQMGSSAEAGQQSLEAFTRTIRESPGRINQLRDLGVKMTGANGKMRDMVDILRDFGTVLSHKDYYVALQYGEQFGLDENTLRAIMGNVGKFTDEYKARMRAAGLDPEAAAARAVAFQNTSRELWSEVNLLYDQVYDHITQKLQVPFERLTQYMEAHGPEIVQVINRIIDQVADWGEAFVRYLQTPEFRAWVDWVTNKETWVGFLAALKDIRDMFAAVWKVASAFFHGVEAFFNSSAWKTLSGINDVVNSAINRTLSGGVHALGETTRSFVGGGDGAAAGGGGAGAGGGAGVGDDAGAGTVGGPRQDDSIWAKTKRFMGFGGGPKNDQADPRSGTRGSGNMSDMMNAAQKELEAQGVPKANSRAAAAALMGNVVQESRGNPNLSHDGGTGYGIYGARLGRRDKMLVWLAQNGYAKNDAAGQARYMAREAMTDYPKTAEALRGATRATLGGVTNTVATNFESPAPATANYGGRRNNAAAVYDQTGGKPAAPLATPGVVASDAPPQTPAPTPPPVASLASDPRAGKQHPGPADSYGGPPPKPPAPAGPNPYGALRPVAPPAPASSSREVHQSNTNNITMYGFTGGAVEAGQMSDAVGAHLNRVHGTALRNIEGAIE